MIERIGSCRVLGEIGSGGMAVVYEAIQEPLNRRVAIKALKSTIAIDSQFAQRFEREAQFMASLQHENILHVIDFVKDDRGLFIIMEYVDGIDLYDLLEQTERLPPEVAAIITLKMARGLEYAHFRGLVHRDIKPANIIISNQGDVKLMDFGIAKHDELSDLTETGTGLGTPSYMSPEQILGDKIDFRSDIFSVGIVLYQMLTGHKPFTEDDSRSVMQKIRLDEYTSPRRLGVDIPRSLERVLDRCMQKLPANRYPSTKALIDDLNEFVSRRVARSYSAQLVTYFRDIGVVTPAQADEILSAAGSRALVTEQSSQSFLKKTAKAQAVALAAVVIGGGIIQFAAGDAPQETAVESAVVDNPGYLRVVASPWAEVHVDGEHVLTTPSAKRLALSPGQHFVKLINPYFQTVEREVTIVAGETEVTQLTMEPLEQP